ncbi:MAG TPA: response regulator [Pilimelia sp.]|nr:response regulator [Pilimelia sp.]
MIRVLVVEDDPVASEAHAAYTERVPGFQVAARAATGAEALRMLGRHEVDLVLLDMNLPDMHGLEVCRAMRAARHGADVIAVTSARDLAVVRAAVSQGIVQYLLKPFVFATLRDKLERYAAYRRQLTDGGVVAGQHQVDRMLATLRSADAADLPKGMSRESLDAVVAAVKAAPNAVSAAEVGAATGTSRITARRYLEYLAGIGLATRTARYGGAGRPELEYRWARPHP